MINFTNAPPDDARGNGLPLIRTPRAKPIVAVVTCRNVIGCNTHFWGGRTVPCDAAECEPCQNGAPWRWHGYVSAFDHRTKLHFLFETTARAAEPFKEWFDQHGTLRGVKFEAIRHQQRANGRVNIRLKSVDPIEFPIPAEPNIMAALAIIWNIPINDFYDAEQIKQHPALGVERGTAEAAAEIAKRMSQATAAHPTLRYSPVETTATAAEKVAAERDRRAKGNGQTRAAAIAPGQDPAHTD